MIDGKVVVYADGIFDLFHRGHVEFLKNAKQFGDILIAGVESDALSTRAKRQPICKEEDRMAIVAACRYVDEVVLFCSDFVSEDFIREYQIDIVVHGDDDFHEEFFRVPLKMGTMKYVPYYRLESTTRIIARVVDEYG